MTEAKTTVEPVNEDHEKLMQILKFVPCTYKIQIWGYGGEYTMGTVDRKVYDYFKQRRLSLSDFAWDHDYAEENNIPEDMWPFPPGSWYECDDMAHAHGADRNCGTLQIINEQDEVIFERTLEDIDGYSDDSPEWNGGDEHWINEKPEGTVVFIGVSSEKGTFFEGELALNAPFDITKLSLGYEDVDGVELVNSVSYCGEEVDNWGGSTNGKSSDFGMYIAGSNVLTGKFEKYSSMDDIEYEMTPWFPQKIKPVRNGLYVVKTPGKNGYNYRAEWNGTYWHPTYDITTELKIKEWQGLAADPDATEPVVDSTADIAAEYFESTPPGKSEWPFATVPEVEEEGPALTDWYPVSVKPVRLGIYEVLTVESINWPYPNKALWDGKQWNFLDQTVTDWRGLAQDPANKE